jgi:outer membrane protein insertion porin family
MMKPILRTGCLAVSLWVASLAQLNAQVGPLGDPLQPTVSKIEIRHVGPPAVSDSLARANIRIKEGDPYRPTAVDDDEKNLYATGYFYNIAVEKVPDEKGVKLVYKLQGNPQITDIKFVGNSKIKKKKLLKKVKSKVGEPMDETKLFTDTEEVRKVYEKAGYQKTTVRNTLSIDEAIGKATVTFEITEAPKVIIQEIRFDGAAQLTKKEIKQLKKTLKTRRHWMFSWITGSGVIKEEEFTDDKDRIKDFYQEKGFIDFDLKDVQYD